MRTTAGAPARVRRPARLGRAIAALLLGVGCAVGLSAPTASAHAALERTVPTAGASLDTAPSEVLLVFGERVRIPAGGVRVLDEQARRRDDDRPRTDASDPATVHIPLEPLGAGAYVVSWRAVSADGHPIRGAFTFRVGGTGDQQAVAELGRRALSGGSAVVGALVGSLRAVDLAALTLILGLAVHALLSPDVGRRRVVLLARATRVVAVLAGTGSVLLYGPYVSAEGLSSITDGVLLDDTLSDGIGRAMVLRTVLAALVATAVLTVVRGKDEPPTGGDSVTTGRRSRRALLVAAAVALAATQVFTGHGAVGRAAALSGIATAVHVLAAGAWFGGLVVVLVGALTGGGTDDDVAVEAVRRWSRTVAVSVSALVLTGLVQVWRQVGSLDALRETSYGRLLTAKTVVVLAVLALGAGARRLLGSEDGTATVRRLRTRVVIETVGAVAVVVLTSLLVDTAPARDALARPVSVQIRAESVTVDATVDPAKRGRNDIHLYLRDRNGLPLNPRSITVSASLPSSDVEPIELRTLRAGPDHFQVIAADLPIAGTWTIEATIRVDEFTEARGSATVSLR